MADPKKRKKLVPDSKKAKIQASLDKRRWALKRRAARIAPPEDALSFEQRVADEGVGNISSKGGLFSICPWVGICALPLNIDPYIGCTNQCSYCFVNQAQKGRVGLRSGKTQRRFYGAVKDLSSLDQMLEIARGKRRVEELPISLQLYGKFFEQRKPLRLAIKSDPFMGLESKYHWSRQILHKIKASGYPLVLTTKGGDLFDEMLDFIASMPNIVVQISLISVDDEVVHDYEPNSPPASQRLAAIRKLTRAGTYVSVRMAPVIPDPRIINEEHMARFVDTLYTAGVRFIEFNPLHLRRGVMEITGNEALRSIKDRLDTELYAGERLSVPIQDIISFGHTVVPMLKARGMEYGHHYLGRFDHFLDDYSSACHCAKLTDVPGFEDYYKATFSQLLLEAKQLWDRHHLPVLIDRSDLDRHWYPKDELWLTYSWQPKITYRDLLTQWWWGIGEWFWQPPYVWVSASGASDPSLPWVDFDPNYGTPTYIFQPADVDAQAIVDKEVLEQERQTFPERAVLTLSGEKVPFPDDNPDHPFWLHRRKWWAEAGKHDSQLS